MDLSIGAWVAILLAVVLGATIQGAIGFGMNLIAVPVLALAAPETLPVAAILLGVPISLSMVRYERASVDRRGIAWIIAGRVPGSIAGAAIVALASTQQLKVVVGVVVLALVGLSLAAPPVPLRPSTQAGAGAVSGITGTAAGIGGPPIALLYQHATGPTMRSTLAASFFLGTILSLTMLGLSGSIGRDGLVVGAACAPFVLLGTRAGRQFHAVLDAGWLRPVVLGFSIGAALLVVADAVI
ncbi:MAG: TSUP family transporter [Acidimicrobiales bacterium]